MRCIIISNKERERDFFHEFFACQCRGIIKAGLAGGNASAQEVRQVCRGAPLGRSMEILRARSGRDKTGHPRAFSVRFARGRSAEGGGRPPTSPPCRYHRATRFTLINQPVAGASSRALDPRDTLLSIAHPDITLSAASRSFKPLVLPKALASSCASG